MRYNIGDKVVIVSERTANMNPDGGMDKYLGSVMTIRDITNTGRYKMVEDSSNIRVRDGINTIDGSGWVYLDSDIDHEKTKKLRDVGYKVGDKVRMLDSIGFLGLVKDSMYEIETVDYGARDSLPIRLTNDDGRRAWVNTEEVELVTRDETPSKLYQLFEHYTHEENQSDVFETEDGGIISYEDCEILVEGRYSIDEITDVYSSVSLCRLTVKPYVEPIKEMTLEEIEEELGYKVTIVE